MSVTATGQLPELTVAQLAFPLLLLAGLTLLAVRLAGWVLGRLRHHGWSWPAAGYLANRRLSAAPGATLAFAVTAALPIGVLVLAAALTTTLRYTTEAKALTFVGADSAFTVVGPAHVPAPLQGHATLVTRVQDAAVGVPVDVLAVDPETFATAAFWDDRFGGSLPGLLANLRYSGSGPVPALSVGAPVAGSAAVRLPYLAAGSSLQIHVVATPTDFPGHKNNPLLVVDARALHGVPVQSTTELWVRGTAGPAARAVAAAGLNVPFTVTAAAVSKTPDLIAVQWTFGFLEALGVLAAVIAVAGLLLYLHARQRARQLAYVFARRMGLSRASHLRSLLVESASMLGLGYAVGSVLAVSAALLVYRYLDPEPYLAPGPLYTNPTIALLSLAAAAAAVCGLAGLVVQRAADRSSAADLLRQTD